MVAVFIAPIPQSSQSSVLNEVWNLRYDLQRLFPDGENGINQMEGWTFQQWAEEFGWKEYKQLKKYNSEAEKDYIYEKYLPLEKALQDISDNHYVREGENKYNCVNFTEDLQVRLNEENIATVMINGTTPNDRIGFCHRWISIQIEPIDGDFVKVSDNYVPRLIVK